jgi:hypothetical protein
VGSADDGVTALREPVAWSADLGAHAGHYRIALRTIAVLDAPPAGPRLVRLPGRGAYPPLFSVCGMRSEG